MEEPQVEATKEELAKVEQRIRDDFNRTLDEFLRQRGITRMGTSDDDSALMRMADAAVQRYHAATADDPTLPRPSKVQLWGIKQRLYVAHGDGPLAPILARDGVEDIHINGPHSGYVVFADHREPLPIDFESEDQLIELVRHYAERAGKHFDPANPIVTVTLRDGSRLNAVLPPVSRPIAITIRKQQLKRFLDLRDLVDEGAIPAASIPLLEAAVMARLNILVSGATGTGKTTLARVLALLIPDGERTFVLETERELWLHELREADCTSLEAREANIEGAGKLTLRDLFRDGALRQRPERIIVGEVRGEEAMEMLQVMASGHAGNLSTIHASSVAAALSRLETLALTDNVPHRAVRQMAASGVDLVIHLASYRRDGKQVRRASMMAFVDENLESIDGGVSIQRFCSYDALTDHWTLGSRFGIDPPRKVEEKLLMAGLDRSAIQVQLAQAHQ